MTPTLVIDALLGLMILSYASFLALYISAFPWNRTFEGRQMVGQKVVLLGASVFFLVDSLAMDRPVEWSIRQGVIVIILINLAYYAVSTAWGLVRIYRRARARIRAQANSQTPTQE